MPRPDPRWLVIALALAAGCGGAGDPAPGGERATCRDDGTCEAGLECWSEVCVRPPAADCGAVAARLAAVRLGNYATDDERQPLLAELRAQCQRDHLTAREGRCLVTAADDDALAECPRALLPELDGGRRRCAPLADRVATLFERGGAIADALGPDAVAEVATIVVEECVADAWPRPVIACFVEAATLDHARACGDPLPRSARKNLERKLERLAGRRRRTRVPPPDPWAPVPTGALSSACQRYLDVLTSYAGCPQVPADAARSIRQAIDTLQTSWAATPPGSRRQVDDACRQGVAGVAAGMVTLGCPIPP